MNNIDKHTNHESAFNTQEVVSNSEDVTTSKLETPLSEAERFGSDLEKATRVRRDTAEILDKIAEILMKAESVGENNSGKLGFEQDITYLNNVSKNLRQGVFRLLVLGDMKRGKSTLLNAIIGEKILPTGVNPCTAVLTIVRYGENKQVTIHFNDNKPPESMDFDTFKKGYTIPPDEAKKLEEEGTPAFPDVEYAVIEYPLDILEKGVELIDSPGLNDTESRNNLALGYINNCHAILFVLSATQPLTQAERRYLENYIHGRELATFFLINNWDLIAQKIEHEDELPEAENTIRQVFASNLFAYCQVNGKNFYEQRVFELNSLAAFKARTQNPSYSLEGTGFDKFFEVLRPFLTQKRIIAELLSVKGLVRQIYHQVHEAVGIRITLLDTGVEELKYKILDVQPEFEQLIEIRDRFKNEIRNQSEHYANDLADNFCNYLSNLDSTFETDFAPYQPDLKVFDLIQSGKRKEFEDKLEQAFNKYSNDRMADWIKKAEQKLGEAFSQIAQSAESYGEIYSQVTDKISAKLNQQKIETGTVSLEEKSPGWTRWAGAAAGIFLGNPAGAALVGFGVLDWKSLIGQFLTVVGANIVLLYGAGTFLGPIGVALAGLVTGTVQLQLARNQLVKLAKKKMKENLPNIAKAERIKVYSFVKEIFQNFENEVTKRIDSDILSRKVELEELLTQKASQEIDKTAEVSRLNTLDSQILTQWNAIEAITDKLLEESM
ncbi:dynamin family protein [Fischerella thermalis]|uniref:dynamin family protein n=1 Tax=Fischerella thermalis TaxID=372787 RepID=UPI0019E1325D|nr:dynamin family protein [Fischerella thermalis]MBF1990836.1 dynamin family protein [Fischerella thermalis M58_A2018_009]MBF2061270.1 dynamin family protein [Fischerella thermalis M66_A2018_004]